MPKVTVTKTANTSPQDAFAKVSTLLSEHPDLKKLDPTYRCDFNAAQMQGKATGKMFSAEMKVTPAGGGSKVEIVVDLPLALTLAKGMVEKTLSKKLDEALG